MPGCEANGDRKRRLVIRVRSRSKDCGSVLLMVVFFCAAMLIAGMAATLDVAQQGKREKEAELIWRGEQYTRGIRMYYRKNGRFPQTLEDMAEAKIQGIRFLRKLYKDPIGREGGKWRLIYVAPSGELIGSLTRTSAIQLGALQRPAGGAVTPRVGVQTPGPGLPPPLPSGTAGSGFGLTPSSGPRPAGPGLTLGSDGKIIGGNIIGVASKDSRASIRIYKGGDTYKTWEFIWDPVADAAGVGGPVSLPGGAPRPGGSILPSGGPPRRIP